MKVFVFGSNLAGRHGKGAALTALRQHGAMYGQGKGLQGRSYAIPTKDEHLRTLPLDAIHQYIRTFLRFAQYHSNMTFQMTRVGCGLAGYTDDDIAPLFACHRKAAGFPTNIVWPKEWLRFGLSSPA